MTSDPPSATPTGPETDPSRPASISVLCAERCHLGEGPTYDAGTDTAWWFDIVEKRLFEMDMSRGGFRVHALPFMASALAYVDGDRQVLATDVGLVLREIATGNLDLVVPVEADNADTRSNDARAHPSGCFWISTMGRNAEPDAGAIYAFRDGVARPIFSRLTIPNAICFSPDGTVGYFADTCRNELCRVRLDPATGLPIEAPTILHRHREAGGLDGAVTDAEGLIWCAIWGGARLNAYSPEGQLVRAVALPALQPSCPAFVGRQFDRMLVTSAYQGMDPDAQSAASNGQTFLLDIGRNGSASPYVRL